MTDIFFRTDGNSTIATGHLMRCLTIARACAKKATNMKPDCHISFIVSDEESHALLQERFASPEEFPVICLHSDYQKPEAEITVLRSLSDRKRHMETGADDANAPARPTNPVNAKPWLFIDSYFATPAYFDALASYFKIAYLDDLRTFACAVDLVINYDTAEDCPYYAKAAKKLLGAQYAPLRVQFCMPSYEVRPQVKNILFSTGGTDPYGMNERLIHAFSHAETLKEMHCHILTSKANPSYKTLLSAAEKDIRIHVHEGVSDTASLMASCDLAVSAGGTTLYELCAAGVPSISFLMADNQITATETFAQKGLIPCAGDIRPSCAVKETVLQNILNFMTDMSQNFNARQKSSHAMRAFLDGCGADRIATQLLQS